MPSAISCRDMEWAHSYNPGAQHGVLVVVMVVMVAVTFVHCIITRQYSVVF